MDTRRTGWADITVESYARIYDERSAAALAWAQRRPDAVRMVRYEDLVSDPSAKIAELCAFAGERFDPDALGTPDEERSTPDPLTWKPVTEQSKDWREFMSADQAADLEGRLGDILDQLGHDRYSAPRSA